MPVVSVKDFVQSALYHPETGYYTVRIRTVGGRQSDFATSATLSGHLAQAIVRWMLALSPRPRHLIEVGAGDGSLAEAMLASLPFWVRRQIRYHVVEASPILAERQKQRRLLRRHAIWHPDIQSAVTAAGHRAAVVCNELADAFPSHLLVWRDRAWHEVSIDTETLVEHEAPFLENDVPPAPPLDGQRIEHALSYRDWLASWVPSMEQLALLTIDYGDTYPALYDRRPGGTLRAYFHHQRLVGHEVFLRPGRQDITADVNFSALQDWGESLGLRTHELTTQREFIRAQLGITQADLHRDLALAYLLDPFGPGTAFKVLVQGK
ncbi:SAM-dependent methyltransferase [soil metagenome]